MDRINALKAKQLRRVKALAAKNPIGWADARRAMWAGRAELYRRDARWDNEQLLEWVAAGELRLVEAADGDSLIAA